MTIIMATIAAVATSGGAAIPTPTPSMQDLLNAPALDPPEGVTRTMTFYPPEQAGYYTFIALCGIVPGAFLVMRLYTKIQIVRRMDVTDCMAVSVSVYLATSNECVQILQYWPT